MLANTGRRIHAFRDRSNGPVVLETGPVPQFKARRDEQRVESLRLIWLERNTGRIGTVQACKMGASKTFLIAKDGRGTW